MRAVVAALLLAAAPLALAQVKSTELSSMDFANMLGGPLMAVVKAQNDAAMTTVRFIHDVGFIPENRTAITVDFSYIATTDNGTDVQRTLNVPFLTMLPIPSLEVDKVKITFNAKIASVTTSSSQSSSDSASAWSAGGNYWWWGGGGNWNARASYAAQSQAKYGNKEQREYSMTIVAKARQATMPEGLNRIMQILADSIKNADDEESTTTSS